MIFVTVGTQDKPFSRLLEAVEKQIKMGNIQEEVIAQVSSTPYESNRMKIIKNMKQSEFYKTMDEARIIITHAGVGTILDGLKRGKTMIVGARRKEFGEHVNDHQLQLLETFAKKDYIIPLRDFEKLDESLEIANTFKPEEYISNQEIFLEKLVEEIEDNL